MINLALNSIEKGSQILEIQAAVLRVIEKVNFRPKSIDTELTDAKKDGYLLMVFVSEPVYVEELYKLEQELGTQFKFQILGRSKNDFFVQLEAPADEFLKLGKRYVYQEPRSAYSSSDSPKN